MNWQLWTRPFGAYVFLWMGLGLLALTVLLMGGAAAARDRDAWVVHTLEILQHLERYESGLLQADVRSRSEFLSPEDRSASLTGLSEAQESMRQVADRVADNPRQAIRAQVLQSLTNRAVATIKARLQDDSIDLVSPALTANSFTSLPLTEAVTEIRTEERRLLSKRQADRAAVDTAFWRMTALVMTVNLGFIWWAYRASRVYIDERNQREHEIRDLNRRLGDQVEEIRVLNSSLEFKIREKTSQLETTVAKLQSSNAELERFSYVASHDLQEPLRQVASFNNLLSMKYGPRLDDTAERYLAYSVAGAKRLQMMLRGLLQYTLISSSALRRTEIPVAMLMEWTLEDLEDGGATIEVEAKEGLVVEGDTAMIRALVSALVSNAIRFRRDGVRPRIVVSVERDPAKWTLKVCDNGIGVDERFIHRMFEMFSRYHSVGEYAGAGAGLAISRKIVQLHGGSIGVEANPAGAGTVFQVEIPFLLESENPLETLRFPY